MNDLSKNDIAKTALLILVILYVASPVDLAPGPIDDILVVLFGMAARKKIGANN